MVAHLLLGGVSLSVVALLFAHAWLEPNDRPFWDFDNPSGFHRFVPPVFIGSCLVMLNWMAWTFMQYRVG